MHVLVTGPIDPGTADFAAVRALVDDAEKQGHRVIVPVLAIEGLNGSTSKEVIGRIRDTEKALILSRAADEVRFAHPTAPDLAEVRAAAVGFQLWDPEKEQPLQQKRWAR